MPDDIDVDRLHAVVIDPAMDFTDDPEEDADMLMPDIEPNLQTEQMERICYGMVSYSYLGSIMDTACSCPNTDGLINFQ